MDPCGGGGGDDDDDNDDDDDDDDNEYFDAYYCHNCLMYIFVLVDEKLMRSDFSRRNVAVV